MLYHIRASYIDCRAAIPSVLAAMTSYHDETKSLVRDRSPRFLQDRLLIDMPMRWVYSSHRRIEHTSITLVLEGERHSTLIRIYMRVRKQLSSDYFSPG